MSLNLEQKYFIAIYKQYFVIKNCKLINYCECNSHVLFRAILKSIFTLVMFITETPDFQEF